MDGDRVALDESSAPIAEENTDARKQAAAFGIALLFLSPLLLLVLMVPAGMLYLAGEQTAAGALLLVFTVVLVALFVYGFSRRRKTVTE